MLASHETGSLGVGGGVGVGVSGLSPEHDTAKSRASDNNVGNATVTMFLNAEVVCLLI